MKELEGRLKRELETLDRRFRCVRLLLEKLQVYQEEFQTDDPCNTNFEWAMKQMRQGKRVYRGCWKNGNLRMSNTQNAIIFHNPIQHTEISWEVDWGSVFATDWMIYEEEQ